MTTTDDKFKWYVVRAITGQEKKVKHSIEVELERDNKLSLFRRYLFLPRKFIK